MKSADDLKTTDAYQAIKAKTLQFPPGLIDTKPSIRSHTNADAFDISAPPLYSLRFLASSTPSETLKSRLAKVRSSVTASVDFGREEHDKRLPPVELTINKKIKFPHEKKKDKNGISQLTSSDRDIIEELRQHLRTQPHNGTTSVLEAIGDPQIREERFYYEPLKSFLQGKEISGHKTFADSGLRVVNIMIPRLDKGQEVETGFILPFALSRHHAATSRNANRFRGGATTTFSYLPKVVGNSLAKRLSEDTKNSVSFYNSAMPSHSFDISYPSLLSGRDNPTANTHFPRKAPVNLPRIGMKRDEVDKDDSKERLKRRKGVATVSESQNRKMAATVQLPTRREEQNIKASNGFPRRANTTATGKAHLIGPMNKMEIIADYSKALQSGLITYNEYIKKLSVLSLHKVTLSNSTQRHFHIVRDESHNMKPHLAHIDVNSTLMNQSNTIEPEQWRINKPTVGRDKVIKTSVSDNVGFTVAGSKTAQPRLHRVDIGEGLTLFEEQKPHPDPTDDIIMTDLTRYTHAHHPRQGRLAQYHWNHEMAALDGNEALYNRHKYQVQKDGFVLNERDKLPNRASPTAKLGLGSRGEAETNRSKNKVALSMEEYLQIRSPNHPPSSSRYGQKNDLSIIGENEGSDLASMGEIASMQNDSNRVGKIPYPLNDSEPMGLGAKDIMRVVDHKLPITSSREDLENDDVSDVDSVFQSHLDNMLKTIKKAKAGKKRTVPELRGLAPTVIPQVRVDKSNKEESGYEDPAARAGERKSEESPVLLVVEKPIPENTPPPTADPSRSEIDKPNSQNQVEGLENSLIIVSPSTAENVKIIIDKANSQLIVNQAPSGSSSPRSMSRGKSPMNKTLERTHGELALPENNTEIRVMTASVDLNAPNNEDDNHGGQTNDRSRLEVVITSMPVAPPASLATSSEGGHTDTDFE